MLVVWQLDTGKKKFLPRIGSPLLYFIWSPEPTLSSVSRRLLFQSDLTHNMLEANVLLIARAAGCLCR